VRRPRELTLQVAGAEEGWATPTLLPYLRPSSTQNAAFAVNSQGWIVGVEYPSIDKPDVSVGVLWIDGVAYDLASLAGQGGVSIDLRITAAFDINDKGQIAARGILMGNERALRLDPY